MEFTVNYNGLADRQIKVNEKESIGLRMLHDNFDPSWKPGDEPYGTMIFTDTPPQSLPIEPPHSTHLATLESVTTGVRPARVKRVWQNKDYYYDCYATQTVKDEFIAGKIAIGDYVLVHFDDELNEQIVTAKVYKSW